MEVYDDYFYTKEHEWVNFEDSTATVGITEYAQDALGDITYVELPAVGSQVEQFEQFASVESVKAASDIFCPISGEVTEVNTELEEKPGLINKSCYEKGWIAKVTLSDQDEQSNLMSADEYRNYVSNLD